MSAIGGDFTRSTQHLLILPDEEVWFALRLNQRPRKTLGFETPADRLRAVLQ